MLLWTDFGGREGVEALADLWSTARRHLCRHQLRTIAKYVRSFLPPGRQTYVKSTFIRSLSDEAIDALVEYVDKSPSPYTFAPFIEHWHGAATRVGTTETAFPHRQYSWNFMAWSMWASPSESKKNIQWTRECWEALRPFLVASSYGN